MDREIVNTKKAPRAIGPYSQAIKANGFLFLSGCIPLCPEQNKVVAANIAEETRQALTNLKNLIEAAGSDMKKLVKVTIFLKDMEFFNEVNSIYQEFVQFPYPARTTVAVKELPLGVNLEIDAIAIY